MDVLSKKKKINMGHM